MPRFITTTIGSLTLDKVDFKQRINVVQVSPAPPLPPLPENGKNCKPVEVVPKYQKEGIS
ncbi:hypothetical protein [Actinoallomurus vinaceus]|uniref:hypothetical protein n=1 Tax=Actinoallomurus vinaceus TaxID=1080074 RepID=UPI0031EBD77B